MAIRKTWGDILKDLVPREKTPRQMLADAAMGFTGQDPNEARARRILAKQHQEYLESTEKENIALRKREMELREQEAKDIKAYREGMLKAERPRPLLELGQRFGAGVERTLARHFSPEAEYKRAQTAHLREQTRRLAEPAPPAPAAPSRAVPEPIIKSRQDWVEDKINRAAQRLKAAQRREEEATTRAERATAATEVERAQQLLKNAFDELDELYREAGIQPNEILKLRHAREWRLLEGTSGGHGERKEPKWVELMNRKYPEAAED